MAKGFKDHYPSKMGWQLPFSGLISKFRWPMVAVCITCCYKHKGQEDIPTPHSKTIPKLHLKGRSCTPREADTDPWLQWCLQTSKYHEILDLSSFQIFPAHPETPAAPLFHLPPQQRAAHSTPMKPAPTTKTVDCFLLRSWSFWYS